MSATVRAGTNTPEEITKIARALYEATKMPGSGSFTSLLRLAEDDAAAKEAVQFWFSVAIAAIDLTNGARARRQREEEQRQRQRRRH